MEKLESRDIIFQAFGGLSNVNMSAMLTCNVNMFFLFNQILKECQHHPSIMAQGTVQKHQNADLWYHPVPAVSHRAHTTDPAQALWNNRGLAFLSKRERCNFTAFLWMILKQWPWVPVLSGGAILLACIFTYLWFTFSSQKQFQTTQPTTAVFRNKHFLSFSIKHQSPLEYRRNATNELGFWNPRRFVSVSNQTGSQT